MGFSCSRRQEYCYLRLHKQCWKRRAECGRALRRSRVTTLSCRLAVPRLCFGLRLLILFGRELLCHSLLEFLSIHSVAFGGVHENVLAACGGTLISRIQQADFQKQLAHFGLVIFAELLDEKFLRGGRILLGLYLVPLCQSRDLVVGEMADQVVCDRQQIGLLRRSRHTLKDGGQDTMASRNGQFLLLDALPFLRPLPLDLLRRRRVGMV